MSILSTIDAVESLPPLEIIHAALRDTTERLATELGQPTSSAPDWSEFEWRIARAVAAIHGISALLCTRLQWSGPPGWQQFLHLQKRHILQRQQRIEATLAEVDAAARQAAIPIVALKGSALLAKRLYAPGERPMADIDLLVQHSQMTSTRIMLEGLGFELTATHWKHLEFRRGATEHVADLGEHADNAMKIELHERIAEILPWRRTDITSSVFPLDAEPGVNGYPSNAAMMLHICLHAAGAMAYRSLRMLHLQDIALLANRMTASEWDDLSRTVAGTPWWALPPLALAARYHPSSVPDSVLAAARAACHERLRRTSQRQTLSDVSLSYPWLEAFPGKEWACTRSEVLKYVVGRIARAGVRLAPPVVPRARAAQTQAVAAPQISRVAYLRRWLFSTARPETLLVVRTALAQID